MKYLLIILLTSAFILSAKERPNILWFVVDDMSAKGFEKFRLGTAPLRVENAVVAALTQVEYTFRL